MRLWITKARQMLGVRAGVQKTIQFMESAGAIKVDSVPLELLRFVEELDTQIVLKHGSEPKKKTRKRKAKKKKPFIPYGKCEACETALGIPGGYGNTDLCGPCCMGEAALLEEFGDTW